MRPMFESASFRSALQTGLSKTDTKGEKLVSAGITEVYSPGCWTPGWALACEQALLFGRAKRAARERASERRYPPNGELVGH